jgi:hypothetical protein
MAQPTISKTGGALTPRMPTIPSHLTKEISNFDQFQERIQALVNEYNVHLVGGFGPIVIPNNGGNAMTWSAQLSTPIGAGMLQPLASDNGPVLERCINRVLEDAAWTLAQQKAQQGKTPGQLSPTAAASLHRKTGT